jgi:hypothetical protein
MSTSYTLGYALSLKDVYFWCRSSFLVFSVALHGTFIKYPCKISKLSIIALYFVRMHVELRFVYAAIIYRRIRYRQNQI